MPTSRLVTRTEESNVVASGVLTTRDPQNERDSLQYTLNLFRRELE